MQRLFVLVVVLLLVGCGEDVGETAVTSTVGVAERPLPTATATSQPPTPTMTSTKAPTETPQSTRSPTPTPFPTSTPLPPLVWAETTNYSIFKEITRSSVKWSPINNEFLASNCWVNPIDVDKQQLFLVSVSDFKLAEITPNNFICQNVESFIWTPDAQHFLFSSSFPEDHPFYDAYYSYGESTIWIADRAGNNSQPVNLDEINGRFLQFTDWLNEKTLVYVYYCGGGHQCIVKFNIEEKTLISTTVVHAGAGYQAGADYVAANNGMFYDGVTGAIAIVNEPNPEAYSLEEAYIRNQKYRENINTRFEDWLPNSNIMLVVTWPPGTTLTNYFESAQNNHFDDNSFNLNTPTTIKLWDVDAETTTDLVADGIFGRFSHNGRYLAYHTLLPEPQLHILEMSTKKEILSIPSAEPTLHWRGEQLFWSSSEDKLVFRDENENWTFLDMSNGRFTPITLNGGARLSNPQWSFDSSYLSVQVAGEGVAILKVP